MAGAVSIGGSTTDPFEISQGLKQRCVLAPTLFTLFLAALLSTVSEPLSTGVFIRTRCDETLFKLARLKASTYTRKLGICELLFADDAAIVSHTLEDIREICKQFEKSCNRVWTYNQHKENCDALPTTTRPNLNRSTR